MMPFHRTRVYAGGEPTGVPADHFSTVTRHARIEHDGRVTALVADGVATFAAMAVHHTATTDESWDAGANVKNLNNEEGEAEYRDEYAWVDSSADPDTKGAYSFPHHMVSSDGKVGAANVKACSSGVGILNGGRGAGKSADWWDDREGIYKHLVAHLKDSGVKDDDLPELKDMSLEEHESLVALAELAETVDDDPGPSFLSPTLKVTVTPVQPEELAARIAYLREVQAKTPEVERTPCTVVTASGEVKVDLPVRWDEEAWDPYKFNPETGGFGCKGAFVSTIASDEFAMTAAGADAPQIVDNPGAPWHAILCVEGLRTDEDPGREIMPGACNFPDLPVSLRLQIHDEGGHWGAVTCGRIDTMDRQELQGYNAIAGTGIFGTDEHGQTAQLLVSEQTQRFISIDPRGVTMEIVEVAITTQDIYDYDEPEADVDWWIRYTELTIGAATIVATPALQQAVIALADVPLPSTPIAVERAVSNPVVASASLEAPPLEWFRDPGFHDGDPRLVRQPDGSYACPLTVTPEGRVYAHVAFWEAEHTAFPGQHRKPPHSPTYAYFMTGARMTAEGTKVPVGNLTMGCGHASMTIRDVGKVQEHYHTAHYDGGYGAIQMADVAAGEDKYGIWVAGALCEGVTPADVRKFESLGLSGDWRERAGTLHMVAALAVPVPGFPITRESVLVAAAEVVDSYAMRAGISMEGECFALVAAGRVHRLPLDERLSTVERRLDGMSAKVAASTITDDERAALAALVA